MNKIALLLRSLTGGVQNAIKNGGGIEAVAKIIDEYKLTEEEIFNAELEYERELTKRLQADMQSDSWLSKSVRPLGFMIWTIMILAIIITDGNLGSFQINKAYLPLIETTYTAFITFYIGSRGVEKAVRVWSKSDKRKQ
tara:strand:+ start:25 stop:441 length:417 start_codon:yes stop_codon:yes gene_type:complete